MLPFLFLAAAFRVLFATGFVTFTSSSSRMDPNLAAAPAETGRNNPRFTIQTYQEGRDTTVGLSSLVRELQGHECKLYDRMKPPGYIVGEEYIGQLREACRQHDGEILVAFTEEEAVLVGYAVVLTKVKSDSDDEVAYEYGEVKELAVTKSARHQGVGTMLLQKCEELVRAAGSRYLRTEVLASNEGAVAAYHNFGFDNHLITMEKKL